MRTEVITKVPAERVDFVKAEFRKAGAKSLCDEPDESSKSVCDEPDEPLKFKVTATFEDADERDSE